jgi:catechol 2,3-dioxygenase-like lactoylglutathione lyase family enzyme
MISPKLDHLTFNVLNYQESKSFYEKYFGLLEKETGENDGRTWGILGDQNSFFVCLYETEDPNLTSNIENSPFKHFGVYVENFDEFVERAKLDQLEYLFDGVFKYPNSRSFYLKDPNGYTIEVTDLFGGGL